MSMLPSHREATSIAAQKLHEWLGAKPTAIKNGALARLADALLQVDDLRFAIVYRPEARRRTMESTALQLRSHIRPGEQTSIPLIVVPHMGETGQSICQEAGVSWLDLSGNAHITGPRLRIVIDGKPNLYKQRGRPASLFASKSSRLVRWLLMKPHHAFAQRELSRYADLDEGYTSRLVRSLKAEGYIKTDKTGALLAANPQQLLADWHAASDFGHHEIIKGHVTARTPDELIAKMATHLGQGCAFTALAAAWHLAPFAGYRLATAFVREKPPTTVLEKLGFREEARGANIWLVIPHDEGVFQGADSNTITCVHPIQAYLDLKGHPERAEEAAWHLLQTVILPSFEKRSANQ